MFSFGSNSETQEPVMARRHSFDVLGPLCVVVFLYFVFAMILAGWGTPYVRFVAVIPTLGILGMWWLFRTHSRRRSRDRTLKLRQQLHDLKQKEFELRFEEAKLSGQFKGWDQEK